MTAILRFACTFLLLLLCCVSPLAAQTRADWWGPAWRYRAVTSPVSGTGLHAVWIETGDRAQRNGSDLRLISPSGKGARFQIVHSTAEGRHLLAFPAEGGERGSYAIYFGGAAASRGPGWQAEGGLFLKTLSMPLGADVGSWTGAERTLQRAETVYGAGPWPQVYDAMNPFGPASDYISVYEGTIDCAKAGLYKFATMSDDASFLFIDEKLVAEWPGRRHRIQDGRRGERGGEIQLAAGRHRFRYVAFAFEGPKRCAAAWMPPGRNRYEIVPASAFGSVQMLKTLVCEEASGALCADFRAEPIHYLELGEAPTISAAMTAVRFVSQSSSARGKIESLQWDFGDGQISREAEPTHVFLAPGRYTVALTVAAAGETNRVTRAVEAGMLWNDLDFSAEKREMFSRWVQEYVPTSLSTTHLLALRDLYTATSERAKRLHVNRELDNRVKDLTGPQWMAVAFELVEDILHAQGKWQEAEGVLKRVLRRIPEREGAARADAQLKLADLYFYYAGDYERALKAYAALREGLPAGDVARRRMALIRMGDVERYRRCLDEAMQYYRQAEAVALPRAQENPDAPPEPRAVVEGRLRHQAEACLAQKDGEGALARIEEWLWHYPTRRLDGRPMKLRLRANMLLRNAAEVKKQADIYIAFADDPDHLPYAHLLAGQACAEMKRAGEARTHLRAVIEKWPESPAAAEAQAALRRLK